MTGDDKKPPRKEDRMNGGKGIRATTRGLEKHSEVFSREINSRAAAFTDLWVK